MKKLLIVTCSISITTGQGRYSIEMIKKLSQDFKLTVFTSERPGTEEKELEGIDLEIHNLPSINKITNPAIYLICLIRLLPHFCRADIVHFFSDYPYCTFFNFVPALLKSKFITAHGTYSVVPLDNKKSRFILKTAFRNAKKVFCISSFTRDQILKRVNLDNLVVINNGIDVKKFSDVDLDSVESREKFILGIGNLKSRKGFHVSIQAYIEAKKKIPELKYYIVGSRADKNYFDKLMGIINGAGLQNDVKILSDLSDGQLIELYYKCELFLLTPINLSGNKFEGFGLVYLEANACGKIAIGTRGCGAEDAIQDGYNGILVEQNNVAETADAIVKILSDNNLKRHMENNALKWAQKFDWNNVVEEYINQYTS